MSNELNQALKDYDEAVKDWADAAHQKIDKLYVCSICKQSFLPNKAAKNPQTCSQSCAGVLRNKNRSPETRARLSKFYSEQQKGENNTNWKGDAVKYAGLHLYVRTKLPQPELCEKCREAPPYDLANKGVYNRSLENWEYLCRKCHMNKDGRFKNLNQFKNNRLYLCVDCGRVNTYFTTCQDCEEKAAYHENN